MRLLNCRTNQFTSEFANLQLALQLFKLLKPFKPLKPRLGFAIRINRPKPFRHRLDLRAADRCRKRRALPVEIAFRNRVVVNERNPPEPSAHERLRAPAADAADANHEHVRGFQPRHRLRTEERSGTSKAFVHGFRYSWQWHSP